MKKRILVIGSVCTELSMRVSEFANEGTEICAPIAYDLLPGGSAALAAVTVTRLGGEAILCSAVGDDAYGKELIGFFEEMDIDARFVRTVKGEKTAICVDAESGDARRSYRSTSLNRYIDAELVEDAFTALPDAVYISMDVSAEAMISAVELAREKSVTVFVDGQRIPENFPLDKLSAIDLIALSPAVTEYFTGISPRDAQSNLTAAVTLAKTVNSKTYMFKYGVGGAFAYKGNFSYYIPYVEGADVRCMELLVPAMIVEMLKSGKSVHACRYASAVIALAARKGVSPITAVPTETEVARYILENEVEL